MSTSVKENYLKALYFLDLEHRKINLTELSKRMNVSKPTANQMVQRLEEQGWVVYQKYKPVQLTHAGRKAAAMVIRKHRLTEMFLQEIMGFGWEEVHEIAEQMEHIDSAKLFARMDEMLEHPVMDPHGSPIPDHQGKVKPQPFLNLLNIMPGRKAYLRALTHSSTDLLYYLNQLNIGLGAVIKLIKIEPFDRSCLIQYDQNQPITVSRKVAESLLVEVIKEDEDANL